MRCVMLLYLCRGVHLLPAQPRIMQTPAEKNCTAATPRWSLVLMKRLTHVLTNRTTQQVYTQRKQVPSPACSSSTHLRPFLFQPAMTHWEPAQASAALPACCREAAALLSPEAALDTVRGDVRATATALSLPRSTWRRLRASRTAC